MNHSINEAEIHDQENQVIARIPGSLSSSVSSTIIHITNVSTSDIYLLDLVHDVYLERIQHSRIFIGACKGTVYLRSCNDCLLTIAAKQVRIRDTTNCILSLFIAEPTVIENSTEIVLTPFNGDYHYRNEHWHTLGYTQHYQQYMNNYKQVFDMHRESGHQSIPSSIHYTILPSLPELTTLYANNEEAILHALWNKDNHGNISPYVRLLVSILFDTFDMDGDGSWDYNELNKYQEITNDDARLPNQQAMIELMTMHGVPLDTKGHLRYYSLLHLYTLQGGEALERDLDMANVLDAWLYNTENGYPITWKISNHVLRKAIHIEYKQQQRKQQQVTTDISSFAQSTTGHVKKNHSMYSNSPVKESSDVAFGENGKRSGADKEKEKPWSAVFNMGKDTDDEPLLKILRTAADSAANTARENEGANISNIRPSDRIPTIIGYIFQEIVAKIEESSSSSSSTGANVTPVPNLEECLAVYDLGRLESQLGGRHAEVGTSDSGVITAYDFTFTLQSLLKKFDISLDSSLLSLATTELGEANGIMLPSSFSGYYEKLKEIEVNQESGETKDSNVDDESTDAEMVKILKYSSALLAIALGKLSSTGVYVINYGFVLSQMGKIDLSARTKGTLTSPAGFPRTNFNLAAINPSSKATNMNDNGTNEHNHTGIFAKHGYYHDTSSPSSSHSTRVSTVLSEEVHVPSTAIDKAAPVPTLNLEDPAKAKVTEPVSTVVPEHKKTEPVIQLPSPEIVSSTTVPESVSAILNTSTDTSFEPSSVIPSSPAKAATDDAPSSIPYSPSSPIAQPPSSINDTTKIISSPSSSSARTSPATAAFTDRRIRLFKLALASATEGIPKDSKSPTASTWLSEAIVDSLLTDFDILPEVWALTEAQAEAEKWLASKSGASALHAEEAHVMKESTDGSSILPGASSNPSVAAQARERVLQRHIGQTLADIAASPATAQKLFWQYVKDVRNKKWPSELPAMYNPTASTNASSSSPTGTNEEALVALQQLPTSPAAQQYPDGFEAWLRWREANRRASARAYTLWKREKDLEAAAAKASGAEVAPLERVERLVHELASSTVQDTRLEVDHLETASSLPSISARHSTRVRRSSRSGLDMEGRMARLRSSATVSSASLSGNNEPYDRGNSRRGSVLSTRSNHSVRSATDAANARRPAPAVVTKAAFEQEFGSALFSLRADPKASQVARALFGARAEARRRVISLLRSDDEAGEVMRQRLIQFEQIVRNEMDASQTNQKDRLSPTMGASNGDNDTKPYGTSVSSASVISNVSTEDVRAVAFQMLIEDEARQTLDSQGIGENLFTSDNHIASMEALAAEEKRREMADEVYGNWKKEKDKEYRRRKQAKAEAEREKLINQEKRKAEAEKAYEAWVRSQRAQTLPYPMDNDVRVESSSPSSSRRHHHHHHHRKSSSYTENEEEEYAHGTWRQYATGEREIPRSIRKSRKDSRPVGSPLTSPYRTVANDYGKGVTEGTQVSPGVSRHRRPRSVTDDTTDNVASLLRHPRTPSPRKSKTVAEPLSMDKHLPEKAVSIAKHALDIVQSSEEVGLGTDVSKHALKHSLGVVKEIAHILATKLETISPSSSHSADNEEAKDAKNTRSKGKPESSSSSLGIVSSPPKGPVVDNLRAVFGSQLALAQSELKNEERLQQKKKPVVSASTNAGHKTKGKSTAMTKGSFTAKSLTAPKPTTTTVLHNLIPKQESSSDDETVTESVVSLPEVHSSTVAIHGQISSFPTNQPTNVATSGVRYETINESPGEKERTDTNTIAPSLRGMAALDTLHEVLGSKLNNARSIDSSHTSTKEFSVPARTVDEDEPDESLPLSSSTVHALRDVLGSKLNNARTDNDASSINIDKNHHHHHHHHHQQEPKKEDVPLAASTASLLRDVLGNKLNAVRNHEDEDDTENRKIGNISYVSQPEDEHDGDDGDDGDIDDTSSLGISPELLRAKRILNEKLYREKDHHSRNDGFEEPDDENEEDIYGNDTHHPGGHHHSYRPEDMIDESIQAYPDDIENEVYAEELRLLAEQTKDSYGEKPVWIPAGKIHRRRSSAIHIRSPVRQGLPPYQEAIYLSQTIVPDDLNRTSSSSLFHRSSGMNSSRASSRSRLGASSRGSSAHSPRSASVSVSPRRDASINSRRSSAVVGGATGSVSGSNRATIGPSSNPTVNRKTSSHVSYANNHNHNERESLHRLIDPEDEDDDNENHHFNDNGDDEKDGGILTTAHVERLKREAQAAEEQMIALKQRYGTSNYQGSNKLTAGNVTKGMHVKPPPPPSGVKGKRNGGSVK